MADIPEILAGVYVISYNQLKVNKKIVSNTIKNLLYMFILIYTLPLN
jgi:hypothetical protein